MKKIDDLIASAGSILERYAMGRMERETVREWVLGLGDYPPPFTAPMREAALWFKPLRDMEPEALKAADLQKLRAIADAGRAERPAGLPLGKSR